MSMVIKLLLAAVAFSAISIPVQSAVVFSANFDSYAQGLNVSSFGGNWIVTNGTLDVIGAGFHDFSLVMVTTLIWMEVQIFQQTFPQNR